jgi:hypothetical protein
MVSWPANAGHPGATWHIFEEHVRRDLDRPVDSDSVFDAGDGKKEWWGAMAG